MSDTAYGIETFQLLDDGESEKELRVEGWFHARLGIRGMQLGIPDKPVMIEDCRRPSTELIPLFGDTARNCRFRLHLRVDAETEAKLGGTRLLVLINNNDGMTIDITSELVMARVVTPPEFGEAEAALVGRFESLGASDALGRAQREAGHAPRGLLALGAGGDPRRLAEAIRGGLAGVGAPDDLRMSVADGRWVAHSGSTGVAFRTNEHERVIAEAQAREAASARLVPAARELAELIARDGRIFVWRAAPGEPDAGMAELHAALRATGARTLLWVIDATEAHPQGTVEPLGDGLLRGHYGTPADAVEAEKADVVAWVELLRAAEAAVANRAEIAADEPVDARPPAPPPLELPEPVRPVLRDEDFEMRRPPSPPPPTETEAWRMLTGGATPPAAAPAKPVSEIPPEDPDPPGFLGRLFGRRQDSE